MIVSALLIFIFCHRLAKKITTDNIKDTEQFANVKKYFVSKDLEIRSHCPDLGLFKTNTKN